jgi:hypothetical protein
LIFNGNLREREYPLKLSLEPMLGFPMNKHAKEIKPLPADPGRFSEGAV